MHPDNKKRIEERVVRAAEAALARQKYVSPVDVLNGMGLLDGRAFAEWRRGRVDFLERVIQGNLKKISLSMSLFRKWAREKGLRPSKTHYVLTTRAGRRDLQFSESGDPSIEQAYRTHFISPELTEKKRERLEGKLNREEDKAVFWILRDSKCSECGDALGKGSFLTQETGNGLCTKCAKLDDLVFLPKGHNKLTRQASKYSERKAVVVRFSRTRRQYERKGLLVEPAALRKAQEELGIDDEDGLPF